MEYLIDGYNLAHWLSGGRDDTPAALRRRLLATLAARVPRDAETVRVYWDVDVRRRDPVLPDREDLGWCVQHHVPDADEAIVDAVSDAERPQRLVVVSRDRAVCGRSRQLGARVMSPAALLGRP